MSQEDKKDIEVFISYSWTTPAHENWVLDLANRLEEHEGIRVTLDKWDLKTGNDVVAFMERMASERALIDKVLIVLDEGYTDKANKRTRGVGTEAQIISPEVYKEVNQEKFIPLVREVDEEGNPYMPTFLRTRKYIDFSKDGEFESAFEELLRDLVNQPQHSRPPKKSPLPNYLFNNSIPRYKTAQIANGIDSIINNRPKQLNYKIHEFLDEFYTALESFEIEITEESWIAIGKQIVDRLTEYTPLRDDLLLFFDKIIKSGQEFDIDYLITFLTKLHQYTYPSGKHSRYHDRQFDIYKFIIHELFINLIALALKNSDFRLIEELLYSSYSIQTNYDNNRRYSYKAFYKYIQSIDDYYRELIGRNLSIPLATLMYARVSTIITKSYLIEADLLCYHIGELNEIGGNSIFDGNWFPITYVYQSQSSLDVFRRISSKRYFNKVKGIYAVDTPQELIEKIKNYKEKHPNPRASSDGPITPIYRLIDIDSIATDR